MRSRVILLLTVLAFVAASPTGRAASEESSAETGQGSSRSLDQWGDAIARSSQSRSSVKFAATDTTTFPLDELGAVAALGISGSGELHGENSLIRLVLIGVDDAEYLVYETYPLIAPTPEIALSDACHETCLLDGVVPAALRVELVDASFTVDAVLLAEGGTRADIGTLARTVRHVQQTEILELINAHLHDLGLDWVAAETPFSRLTYAEKATYFPEDAVINLQGLEYYVGGAFTVGAGPEAAITSEYVEAFDWRTRHGATDPSSPYYDGDPAGSGWATPVKDQRACGSCWAFGAVGALESVANLYYNAHVDLDLSEQEMVSCAGCGGCGGGSPGCTLDYIARSGIVDEGCFPYTATDAPCAPCGSPTERITLAGQTYINPSLGEDYIKSMLLDHGPLTFGIVSWWHSIVLVGWSTDPVDGQTEWIFKNSWGPWWGEAGYGKVKTDLSNIYLTSALHTPITSLIVPRQVTCVDHDGDGYANWGLSDSKPASCPAGTHVLADCDDSDPTLGQHAGDGSCLPTNSDPELTVSDGLVLVGEGATARNQGTAIDPNGDPVTLSASVGTVVSTLGGTWSWSLETDDGPNESQTVTITADDGRRGTAGISFVLTVSNIAPTATLVASDVVRTHTDFTLQLTAPHDPSTADVAAGFEYAFDCGDGIGYGAFTTASSRVCRAAYAKAPYEVRATVRDKDGGATESTDSLVVYAPDDFVTGGGWIYSPAGAQHTEPSVAGKANFGFVARYEKGGAVPTGQTEFRFKGTDFDFHSASYGWLVIDQDGARARLRGTGFINGRPAPSGESVQFLLTVRDQGRDDALRLEIWWEDAEGGESVIYDTGSLQPLGGGSIVIHGPGPGSRSRLRPSPQ